MRLDFRPIVNCDQSYHDNVDDDWEDGYYEMKEDASLQLNKETGYFEKVK